MKQKLKLYNSKVIAPDYCPYKEMENDTRFQVLQTSNEGWIVDTTKNDEEIYTVNMSLCVLCRICQFEPDLKLEEDLELKTEEFVKYLTLINTEVSKLIVRQFNYLQKDNQYLKRISR